MHPRRNSAEDGRQLLNAKNNRSGGEPLGVLGGGEAERAAEVRKWTTKEDNRLRHHLSAGVGRRPGRRAGLLSALGPGLRAIHQRRLDVLLAAHHELERALGAPAARIVTEVERGVG